MSHKTDLRQVTQVRSVISCHTHSHAHSSVHPGHRGCRWSLSVAARAKNNNQHRKLKVTRVFLLSIRTKGRSSEKDMQEQGGNRFRSRTSTNPQGIPSCPVRNMVLCLTMCFCHFWLGSYDPPAASGQLPPTANQPSCIIPGSCPQSKVSSCLISAFKRIPGSRRRYSS